MVGPPLGRARPADGRLLGLTAPEVTAARFQPRSSEDPELHALGFEEIAGSRALEVGQSGEGARLYAGGRDHRHRARSILDRPAGFRVEDVAKPAASKEHVAARVATRGQASFRQLDPEARGLTRPLGIIQADGPGAGAAPAPLA